MSVTMPATGPAGAAPPRATPGTAALTRLTRTEFRLFLRERVGPIWGVGFPLLLLIIFGSIPSFSRPKAALGGLTELDLYVPILIGFVIAMLALNVLPRCWPPTWRRGSSGGCGPRRWARPGCSRPSS